jgi:hypothetical protein
MPKLHFLCRNRSLPGTNDLLSILAVLSLVFLLLAGSALAGGKWYNYYENGKKYMKEGKYLRAIHEFQSAISLEFEEKDRMRTYGMHFIKYYPHRYLAEAYYYLGDLENARKEIDISVAFQSSKEGTKLQQKIYGGEPPPAQLSPEEMKRKEQEELALAEERRKLEEEKQKFEEEKERLAEKDRKEREKTLRELKEREERLADKEAKLRKTSPFYVYQTGDLPAGALTYDPAAVAQVGSRLSIAILKFSFSGPGRDLSEDILNELITRLYSLKGRFNIMEREKYDKVLREQMRGMTGQIDEATAAKAGKMIGVDAVLTGSITEGEDGSLKVWGRLINTETGQVVTAHDAFASACDVHGVRIAATELAVKVYNDLPLVEGYVMDVEGNNIILDLGADKHMKKDMQCVVFREGEDIKHPISGEVLGKKREYLGEVVLTQVQERSSVSTLIIAEKNAEVSVGDKVVVK